MSKYQLFESKFLCNKVQLSDELIELLLEYNPDRKIVLTMNVGASVLIYPTVRWEVIKARLEGLSSLNAKARIMQRILIGFSREEVLNESGEVTIPKHIEEVAGLEENIVLLAVNKKIEVWNKRNFDKEIEIIEDNKRYKLYTFFDNEHTKTNRKVLIQ